MSTQTPTAGDTPTDLDVLIVGAGVSGIGAAYHLQRTQPGKSYAVLEAREAVGGTWDLFRYPGIRSDSDLHTFGYAFRPWTDDKAIADGPAIREYVEQTAVENGIDRHIRFETRVLGAQWSTPSARWTVSVEHVGTGEQYELTARWLFGAAGYYRYDDGFTPQFEGRDRFAGRIVHPQRWPEDLDYRGKRVVVIGSGATAITLVPAMAKTAGHVTMLQRSPTYILPRPASDPFNRLLRRLLSEQAAYAITRRKNVAEQKLVYNVSRRYPRQVRAFIRAITRFSLRGSGIDVDTHFKPRYEPWDQRMCAIPDGDLFKVLRTRAASVVTDQIATFTERGILLESGRELEADIIVTATGFNVQPIGGIELVVDGHAVELRDTVAFKGMMLSGVPNFAFAVGYTNFAWTLKVDLVCEHFCRLLTHADEQGADAFVPELPDEEMTLRPLLDFDAGYVKRSLSGLPQQGDRAPWHLAMDYKKDTQHLLHESVADADMRFFSAAPANAAAA